MRGLLLLALSGTAALSLPGRPTSPKAAVDPSTLPGDPSLVLNTNIVIGEKMEFMKAVSKIISKTLSKPESYVAVCVNDGLDMIWAGEDTPCALGTLCSLGQINKVSVHVGKGRSSLSRLQPAHLCPQPCSNRRTTAQSPRQSLSSCLCTACLRTESTSTSLTCRARTCVAKSNRRRTESAHVHGRSSFD